MKVTQWLEKIPYLKLGFAGSDTGMRRTLGTWGLGMLGPAAKPAIPAQSGFRVDKKAS